MTSDDYYTVLRSWGYDRVRGKPASNGTVLMQGRDGDFTLVPDPTIYEPDERGAILDMLRARLQIICN